MIRHIILAGLAMVCLAATTVPSHAYWVRRTVIVRPYGFYRPCCWLPRPVIVVPPRPYVVVPVPPPVVYYRPAPVIVAPY